VDKKLYVGSFDGYLRIIDLEKTKLIQSLQVDSKITSLDINSPNNALLGTLEQGIFNIDLLANKVIRQLFKPLLFSNVNDIIYITDDTCITSVNPISSVVFDCTILAWDISSVFLLG